ncbi:MAG TPA: hypothetical protein VLX12_02680 [Syntrophorhabdales bacterium]|nr:hypothetical protein [Syntrophorhabdales bacterium]
MHDGIDDPSVGTPGHNHKSFAAQLNKKSLVISDGVTYKLSVLLKKCIGPCSPHRREPLPGVGYVACSVDERKIST